VSLISFHIAHLINGSKNPWVHEPKNLWTERFREGQLRLAVRRDVAEIRLNSLTRFGFSAFSSAHTSVCVTIAREKHEYK